MFAVHNECEYYDQASDQWLPVAPMTTRRSRCGVATVHGMLYAIGGYENFQDWIFIILQRTDFYDIEFQF